MPLGLAGDAAMQAAAHPAFRWLLTHHPLLALPGLAGTTLFSAAALAGAGDVAALRGWMVAMAAALYIWSDRRA